MIQSFFTNSQKDLKSRFFIGAILLAIILMVSAMGESFILFFMLMTSMLVAQEILGISKKENSNCILAYIYIYICIMSAGITFWLYTVYNTEMLCNIFYIAIATTIVTDTMAYIGGRSLGDKYPHKFSPTISPNKTTIGATCGLISGSIIFLIMHSYLFEYYGLNLIVIQKAIFVTSIAILADLGQSAFKRSAMVKDSGRALGAHGGFWDRFDAFLPVFCITAIVYI